MGKNMQKLVTGFTHGMRLTECNQVGKNSLLETLLFRLEESAAGVLPLSMLKMSFVV